MSAVLHNVIAVTVIVAVAVGIYFLCYGIFLFLSKRERILRSRWHPYVTRRSFGKKILPLIPGIAFYFMASYAFEQGSKISVVLHKADVIFLIVVFISAGNALLLTFLDLYSHTDKNKSHPLQGLVQGLQVILFFIGGIIIVAILFDKSPATLLTGLGASAAVLMLVFKDSILGLVAGIQLSQNNMIRLGDWIQMPDGSANGVVEEITLNTVKVRNWDNTISTIPPYTLVSSSFKNWRGMMESDGRRVSKKIFLDIDSIVPCSPEMFESICSSRPLVRSFHYPDNNETTPTNSQIYRYYIEQYLRRHPSVSKGLDLIIAQREQTRFGLPVEIYFFIKDKVWNEYESIQSDIFDHLIVSAPDFGLKLYQLPDKAAIISGGQDQQEPTQ